MANPRVNILRLSIRVKLVIIIVGLLLISIFALSFIQFIESRALLRSRILSYLTAVVDARKEYIVNSLNANIENTQVNSSRRLPRGYLSKIISRDPALEGAKAEAFKTLYDAKNSNNSIVSIEVMDLAGTAMISTNPGTLGKDLSGSRVFSQGKTGVYISDMYFRDGKFLMDISCPQYDPYKEEGGLVGVFKVTYDESKLINRIENYNELGATGEIALAVRSGDNILFITPLRHKKAAPFQFTVPFNSNLAVPSKNALMNKKGLVIGKDYRGELVLAAYDYIPMTNWGIVGKIDIKEAFTPIRKLLLKDIIAALLIFVFSSLAVIIFANFLSRPIKKLSEMADIIAGGNLNSRVDINTGDEIGQLAASFNRMADNLKKITASRNELNEEIAKRKEAENELKDAQSKLLQASKMAAIGQLAGGVAHELNNPLTGVLNNVQLIKMEALDRKDFSLDDFKRLLDTVEESALRCKKIIDSLLDFTRPSKGKFEPTQLNMLVKQVVSIINQEMKLVNVPIHNELDPGLPEIKCDAQLIQQVIVGLIANAKWAIDKKKDQKGGAIAIKTRHDPKNKSVYLEISDNGIGIPKENLSKIFEPFFTTKDVGEGTGLGLALIYNIVKNHNGNIEVESRANAGTSFKIMFPYA
ncbi:MAG: ATP-binding protein [Candidatus Omnitrophica bacterium]|nr:ATP-binding protein [Candidatus Omnitrophota bacterium]